LQARGHPATRVDSALSQIRVCVSARLGARAAPRALGLWRSRRFAPHPDAIVTIAGLVRRLQNDLAEVVVMAIRDWSSETIEPSAAPRADGEPRYVRHPPRPHIDVRFDGTHWSISHESLRESLRFANLDDAEHRAGEISRETGHGVMVFAADGALIAAYAIAKRAGGNVR
jgi:hypothetical protein